jgi:2-polyprenyl-3-methyl-5-hydroxy-6-metoxy-1,4-benzoquinol methylase
LPYAVRAGFTEIVSEGPSNVNPGGVVRARSRTRDTETRERVFWDEHVPSLDACLAEYRSGPDAFTRAMLDAVEPLAGATVLDFACGVGVTTAWAAARGATVTGIDVSPQSITRARELCDAVGVKAWFVAGTLDTPELAGAVFGRIIGRFALHHTDCTAIAPLLASHLKPGGTGAFVETMDSNPMLRLARRHLVGRFGIPRFGTLDEHPLTRRDLAVLTGAFGELELQVPRMTFLRVLDRQVLRHRSRAASRVLGATDDFLLTKLHLQSWSYHQLVVVRRGRAG